MRLAKVHLLCMTHNYKILQWICALLDLLQLHHAICLNISKDNRFWATKEGVKKRGLLCRIFFCAGITHSHVPMWWFPQVKVPTSLHIIYSKEMMMWTSIFWRTHVSQDEDCPNNLVCHESEGSWTILGEAAGFACKYTSADQQCIIVYLCCYLLNSSKLGSKGQLSSQLLLWTWLHLDELQDFTIFHSTWIITSMMSVEIKIPCH